MNNKLGTVDTRLGEEPNMTEALLLSYIRHEATITGFNSKLETLKTVNDQVMSVAKKCLEIIVPRLSRNFSRSSLRNIWDLPSMFTVSSLNGLERKLRSWVMDILNGKVFGIYVQKSWYLKYQVKQNKDSTHPESADNTIWAIKR